MNSIIKYIKERVLHSFQYELTFVYFFLRKMNIIEVLSKERKKEKKTVTFKFFDCLILMTKFTFVRENDLQSQILINVSERQSI